MTGGGGRWMHVFCIPPRLAMLATPPLDHPDSESGRRGILHAVLQNLDNKHRRTNGMSENSKTIVKGKSLTFERVFNAPRQLVWKAWSDPELMKKWWGPRGWSTPEAKIDFKVG